MRHYLVLHSTCSRVRLYDFHLFPEQVTTEARRMPHSWHGPLCPILHFPDVILSKTWLLSRFKQEYAVCVVYLQIVVHSPHLSPCINEEMSAEINITVIHSWKEFHPCPFNPWEHPHLSLLARIITSHFVAKLFLRKRRYVKDALYLQNPPPVNTTG